MKNEKWIIYLIVAFTSITTVLLLAGNTLVGFLRAAIGFVLLDAFIMYWEDKRVTLKDTKQRKWAHGMMWAGVGVMAIFAIGFGIEKLSDVDAVRTVDVFGYTVTATLYDVISAAANIMIGLWVVLTLGVVIYLRGIDPDILNHLEQIKAEEEAEKGRRHAEQQAYKTAMEVTSTRVGTEKAIRQFRQNLIDMGCYKPFEIEEMVKQAEIEIQASRSGVYTVDTSQQTQMVTYKADAGNFTPPSTPKK